MTHPYRLRSLLLRSALAPCATLITMGLLAACGDDASDTVPVDDVTSGDTTTDDAGTDAAVDAGTDARTDAADDADVAADTEADAAADASSDTVSDAPTDTPGADTVGDTGGSFAGVVTINEVAPAGTPDDWFELANAGDSDVDLSGWTFTDDIAGEPGRALFPDTTVVPAGGFLLIAFDGEFPGFGLAGDEELGVFDADGNLVDGIDWEEGFAPEGASLGRIPNFDGPFVALFTPTPGDANVENAAACGNGALDDGETCDDGATEAGDGCDATCNLEDGYACDGTPSVCATVCGDGIVAGDEACDDGNTDDGDGCSSSCEPDGAICGDGTVDPGEACDDGNGDDDDGCSDACRIEDGTATIVINEVAAAGDPADWFELTNVSGFPVSLDGWTFTDEDPTHVVTLPADVVAPGAYVSFERDGATGFDFGIGRADAASLFDPDGDEVDFVDWEDGDSPEGGSLARIPDGVGDFATVTPATRDASND